MPPCFPGSRKGRSEKERWAKLSRRRRWTSLRRLAHRVAHRRLGVLGRAGAHHHQQGRVHSTLAGVARQRSVHGGEGGKAGIRQDGAAAGAGAEGVAERPQPRPVEPAGQTPGRIVGADLLEALEREAHVRAARGRVLLPEGVERPRRSSRLGAGLDRGDDPAVRIADEAEVREVHGEHDVAVAGQVLGHRGVEVPGHAAAGTERDHGRLADLRREGRAWLAPAGGVGDLAVPGGIDLGGPAAFASTGYHAWAMTSRTSPGAGLTSSGRDGSAQCQTAVPTPKGPVGFGMGRSNGGSWASEGEGIRRVRQRRAGRRRVIRGL